MLDLIIRLNCSFTDSDKEECLPTIEKVLSLAGKARTSGILALETELEDEKDCFIQTALSLVVDGTDPVLIKEILQHMIIADRFTGGQLLKRLILSEGILAIQNGEHPRLIRLKLHAMLGEKYVFQLRDAAVDERIAKQLDIMGDRQALPESAEFDKLLLMQPDLSIERILRELSWHSLICALQGCGIDLIRKITDNLSKNIALQLCDTLLLPRGGFTVENILSAQTKVRKVIARLEEAGEIVLI